jgi:hypothetical protein
MGLRHPFIAGTLKSLKALLTVESPAAFRRRMLFISKDALPGQGCLHRSRKAC